MVRVIEGKLRGDGLKFAVVASRFHEAIVERLLDGAVECLERHGVNNESIDVVRVPGAFEIPAAANELAFRGTYDAVITVGVLLRGDTPHFDFISSQVTHAISRVSTERRLPVSFGVITCNTMEQAHQRTARGNNKGWEAALAAIEMANLYKELTRGRGDAETRRGRSRAKATSASPRPRVPASPRRKGGR